MKGAIYYVAIATLIFSCVKITRYFHTWRYQVFERKLTWYFIGVYIIKAPIAPLHSTNINKTTSTRKLTLSKNFKKKNFFYIIASWLMTQVSELTLKTFLLCSAIGIGFNGAQTNCGIARILGILLMNSWDTYIYFLATTIICSLSTLNSF